MSQYPYLLLLPPPPTFPSSPSYSLPLLLSSSLLLLLAISSISCAAVKATLEEIFRSISEEAGYPPLLLISPDRLSRAGLRANHNSETEMRNGYDWSVPKRGGRGLEIFAAPPPAGRKKYGSQAAGMSNLEKINQ